MRWWGTAVVAFVLLVLGAGLPLLDRALGNRGRLLAPGTVLSAGAERDGVRPITFSVPSAGWVLNRAETSLTSNVELSSDDVVVNVSVVVPLGPLDAGRLWDGLGRIVAAGGHSRLRTRPAPITTVHGLTGLTGRLAGPERIGTATVFARDTLGATVTASGPPRAFRGVAGEVDAMMRTVRIAAPWR